MDQSYQLGQSCGLESLPLDLKVAIFKVIQDVPTLISLTLTSSSFYHICKGFTPQILSAVLSNEIPAAVMDDVRFTLASILLPNQSIDGVLEFLANYHPHPETTAGQIIPPKLSVSTLDDALEISILHSNVRFFTNDFCSSILSAHPISGSPNLSQNKLSDSELMRIMRAFYWFELHCNLYQKSCYPDDQLISSEIDDDEKFDAINDRVSELLFKKFYPWEIEQLCCVYEYLSRKLAPAFEEMVEYNVSWSDMVPYDDEYGQNEYKEQYYSEGLDFVRQVIYAETFDARKMAFDSSYIPAQILGLAISLELSTDYTSELSFDLASPPLLNEDLGPYRAWRWAYKSQGGIKRYCADLNKKDLREWGYCFWDLKRLRKWSIFKFPWTPKRANQRQAESDKMKMEWDAKIQVSRTARKEIHDRGGRGWWVPGDWSRITWTHDTESETPEEIDGEPEWVVDELLASRISDGKLQYQLRWYGWNEDAEWYDATLLKNAPMKVQIFHEQYPNKPGPPRRLQEWVKAAAEDKFLEDCEEDNYL